jgi:hypothetical protein
MAVRGRRLRTQLPPANPVGPAAARAAPAGSLRGDRGRRPTNGARPAAASCRADDQGPNRQERGRVRGGWSLQLLLC